MFVYSPQGFGSGVLYLFVIPGGERGGGEQSPETSQCLVRAGGGTKKSQLQVSLSLCLSAPGALSASVSVIVFLCLPRCLSTWQGVCLSPFSQASVKVSAHLRQELKEIY